MIVATENNFPGLLLFGANLKTTREVRILKSFQRYVNVFQRKGKPSIILAVEEGNIEVVKLLLDRGVDIEERFRSKVKDNDNIIILLC